MFGRGYRPAREARLSPRPLPVAACHGGGCRYVGRAFSAWGARRLAERSRPPGLPNRHVTVGLAEEAFEERGSPRHWRVDFTEGR